VTPLLSSQALHLTDTAIFRPQSRVSNAVLNGSSLIRSVSVGVISFSAGVADSGAVWCPIRSSALGFFVGGRLQSPVGGYDVEGVSFPRFLLPSPWVNGLLSGDTSAIFCSFPCRSTRPTCSTPFFPCIPPRVVLPRHKPISSCRNNPDATPSPGLFLFSTTFKSCPSTSPEVSVLVLSRF